MRINRYRVSNSDCLEMFSVFKIAKKKSNVFEKMFEHIFAFFAWLSLPPPEHVGPCDRPVGANQPVACVVWAAHLYLSVPSSHEFSLISKVQRNSQVEIQQVEKFSSEL